jgi:hypothetical protein
MEDFPIKNYDFYDGAKETQASAEAKSGREQLVGDEDTRLEMNQMSYDTSA